MDKQIGINEAFIAHITNRTFAFGDFGNEEAFNNHKETWDAAIAYVTWGAKSIDEALTRSSMAESVTLPIERYRSLLIAAKGTTPTPPAGQTTTEQVQPNIKLNLPPEGQVEVVARVICKANLQLPDEYTASGKLRWTLFIPQAKAALQASGAEHIAGLVAKNDELRDALLDMVWQFCSRNDKLAHSFMSAEEHAFDVLDLDNGMTYEEAEEASKEAALPPELRGK